VRLRRSWRDKKLSEKDREKMAAVPPAWYSRPCLLIDEDTGRTLQGLLTVQRDPVQTLVDPTTKAWVSTEEMDRWIERMNPS
jgi:hypothetical protein